MTLCIDLCLWSSQPSVVVVSLTLVDCHCTSSFREDVKRRQGFNEAAMMCVDVISVEHARLLCHAMSYATWEFQSSVSCSSSVCCDSSALRWYLNWIG